MKLSDFFQVKAQAGKKPVISIRGVIGNTFDDETWSIKNTETEVLKALAGIPVEEEIEVRVNSEGGLMKCALGIRNAWADRAEKLTFFNDGYMASSAAILAPKGSKIICPKSSFVMIHHPSAGFDGNYKNAEEAARTLKAHSDVYADIIAERIGKTKEEVLALMDVTTWWTGEQAVAIGFASEDGPEPEETADEKVKASALAVFARYKNVPENLRSRLVVASAGGKSATEPKPETKKMNKIIAALVAAGFTVPADANEETVLPHISALINERTSLKTENQKHVEARKKRVTALVEAAFGEKIISEARKTSLIALGETNEEEVNAQITDLRAIAAANKPQRGANPAKRGEGEEENPENEIEALHEQMGDKKCTADKRGSLAIEALNKRGLGDLFKKNTTQPAKN